MWLETKKAQMALYRDSLSSLPIQFQQVTGHCSPGWHLCVIALAAAKDRQTFMERLKDKGIDTLIHYPIPNHQQAAFSGLSRQALPETEALAGRILSLPLNTVLSKPEQEYIIDTIIQSYCMM